MEVQKTYLQYDWKMSISSHYVTSTKALNVYLVHIGVPKVLMSLKIVKFV